MKAPIYMKKFDRRTAIFISKDLNDIKKSDIETILFEFFIRCKVTEETGSKIHKEYKLNFRLTEREKTMVLNRLYKLAEIDYTEIKTKNREIVKNRPKKKKIVDESIITGFSGNMLLNGFQFYYKVIN